MTRDCGRRGGLGSVESLANEDMGLFAFNFIGSPCIRGPGLTVIHEGHAWEETALVLPDSLLVHQRAVLREVHRHHHRLQIPVVSRPGVTEHHAATHDVTLLALIGVILGHWETIAACQCWAKTNQINDTNKQKQQ